MAYLGYYYVQQHTDYSILIVESGARRVSETNFSSANTCGVKNNKIWAGCLSPGRGSGSIQATIFFEEKRKT